MSIFGCFGQNLMDSFKSPLLAPLTIKKEKLSLALPGVEPGSPGGKPVVLTARLQRISVPEQRYAQVMMVRKNAFQQCAHMSVDLCSL